MAKKRPYLTPQQAYARVRRVEAAVAALREARQELRYAGARQAHAYVARALKSALGARNHADGMLREAWRERDETERLALEGGA